MQFIILIKKINDELKSLGWKNVSTIMNDHGLCENNCTQTALNFGYEIGKEEDYIVQSYDISADVDRVYYGSW